MSETCPVCKVDMVGGLMIPPVYPDDWYDLDIRGEPDKEPVVATNDTLELKECWKCPKCGHSTL